MFPYVIIFAWIIFIVVLSASSIKNYSKKNGNLVLKNIADTLGLRFIKGGIFNYPKVFGEIDGLNVSAGWNTLVEQKSNTCIFDFSVRYDYPVQGTFNINSRSRNILARDEYPHGELIKCGDDAFDSSMYIYHNEKPATVSAILTYELRKEILALAENSYSVSVTKYSIHVSTVLIEPVSPDRDSIISGLRKITAVAKLLLSYNDLKALHIHNILHDPVEEVRLINIKMLASNYPIDGKMEHALASCLKDDNFKIQFEAAKNLRPEGLKHILKLISKKIITGETLLIEAVKTFGDASFKESSSDLIDVYNYNHRKDLRLEILETFKKFGEESLSSFLVSLLDYADDDIVDAAVDALATCGNVQSVEKLIQRAGKSINPFFRSRINDTVLQIQSRLGSVEKGWLSVSELKSGEGDLSIADGADEGALSISDSELKN